MSIDQGIFFLTGLNHMWRGATPLFKAKANIIKVSLFERDRISEVGFVFDFIRIPTRRNIDPSLWTKKYFIGSSLTPFIFIIRKMNGIVAISIRIQVSIQFSVAIITSGTNKSNAHEVVLMVIEQKV